MTKTQQHQMILEFLKSLQKIPPDRRACSEVGWIQLKLSCSAVQAEFSIKEARKWERKNRRSS